MAKTSKEYGHFDDSNRSYVLTNPAPPRPWINYLGNGRLQAFISQGAGGMLWYLEPEARRISRYQYIASPQDRPGFYLYIRDRRTGSVWNPHFAPRCVDLDSYECRHSPGVTSFMAVKDGIKVSVDYFVPMADEVLIWKVRVVNESGRDVDLDLANYIEFSILELAREQWWCYIQKATTTSFNRDSQCIRYDYFPYEAVANPRMVVGCSEKVIGFDCSRDAFLGRTGSLENPESLRPGRELGNSELPLGGHGCGVLGTQVHVAPGEAKDLSYVFALADDWAAAEKLVKKYSQADVVAAAMKSVQEFWNHRLLTLQAATGDAMTDRFINTWGPYQGMMTATLPSTVSAEHMGIVGMLFRDMTQYSLTAANLDPELASTRLTQVFAAQKSDGMGCWMFWPWLKKKPNYDVRRSDNTVWQTYTINNLIAETGDLSFLDREVPFCDGGSASIYEHNLRGLRHIYDNRGPTGLPLMFYADWNDCLVYWQSDVTESVMLGMQLEYSCKMLADLAQRLGKDDDAAWCRKVAAEMDAALNCDKVWDGRWYRRLIMGDKHLGGKDDIEGQIWINPQTWSVICGCGDYQGRGAIAMDEVQQRLDSPLGLVKQDPPVGCRPETRKPGQNPGVGENGGIFCHTNTWAIIAQALLGRNDQALATYRKTLPAVVADHFGQDHYLREPYAYVSSVVGPISPMFGQGGISWITGTASWMYIAATQYVLGLRPTLDGLSIRPCLPKSVPSAKVQRRFRGCMYDIQIDNAARGSVRLEVDGRPLTGNVIPIQHASRCTVKCWC